MFASCWATTAAGFAAAPHQLQPAPITLEWVGDIALSSQRGLPPGGVIGALAPVRGLLQAADVTLGNLEGTLSVGGPSKCARLGPTNCFAFQAPPAFAGQFHAVGFDLFNEANNHSMDFGATGRAQTVAALNAAGIAHTGFPGEITVLRVAGMRVAFLGFAPYPYDADLLDILYRTGQALGAAQLVHRDTRDEKNPVRGAAIAPDWPPQHFDLPPWRAASAPAAAPPA